MEVSQNQNVSRVYPKEIVVDMFDSAKNFLTTTP